MSKKLGKLVREARTAKNLTQAALAEQVEGLTSSEIGKIERGESEPSQEVLKRMAKVLGVTQKSLLEAASGKASSGKTASGKASSSGSSSISLSSLTASEKKLIRLYREADSSTKKAAVKLLSGDGNLLEILGPLLAGKGDLSTMASSLFGSLLSGQTRSGGTEEGAQNAGL
ncbi:MAG: helix-turn-helix transcriptional regulator [Eubacteriales bacterium]|nr:helix-turn-helix transcriptional regulator [Eubacteriales bacterium]